MRVLLVDDHEISRAAISALLRTEGADVAGAGTGEAAIAVAIAFHPAVAIIDVTPADATGFRIADQLQALPDGHAVVLTSSADKRRFDSQLDGYRFVESDLCPGHLGGPGSGAPHRLVLARFRGAPLDGDTPWSRRLPGPGPTQPPGVCQTRDWPLTQAAVYSV
jgi:CheY-like chemotaxis protein